MTPRVTFVALSHSSSENPDVTQRVRQFFFPGGFCLFHENRIYYLKVLNLCFAGLELTVRNSFFPFIGKCLRSNS
jgi:hypothetical protein